jgi:hypothetical protein
MSLCTALVVSLVTYLPKKSLPPGFGGEGTCTKLFSNETDLRGCEDDSRKLLRRGDTGGSAGACLAKARSTSALGVGGVSSINNNPIGDKLTKGKNIG